MTTPNSVALITGASAGIGRAVALSLAERGMDVALMARNVKRLEAVAAECEAHKVTARVYAADVSDRDTVAQQIQSVINDFNRIDVVLNNAGIFRPGTSDCEPSDFHEMLHVNVLGAYHIIHNVVPQLKQQGNGYLINVASMAGKRGLETAGGYCASKYALVGLSASLYKELVPLGINVTALCPSVIETDMTKNFDMPNEQKIQLSDITRTVNYLLDLGSSACVPEVLVRCRYVMG